MNRILSNPHAATSGRFPHRTTRARSASEELRYRPSLALRASVPSLALQIGVPSLALRVGVVATLAVAVAIAGSLTGCHSSSSADPQQAASLPDAAAAAVRVTAARPVRKTLRLESVQPGQIEAFEQTPLFAKLPAYVEKLYVDIGDRVEGNQLLVDLFLPELKDEVRQKEAALVQAQAEIELATAAIRAAEAAVATARANISAAEAGNIRADADYTRWQSQFARISQLVTGGSLDRKLEDETRDSLKAAEAARGEVRAKVQSAKAALVQSQADVAKAQANEAVARARQGNAQADLSRVRALLRYTQIRAPYAGVVTERNVVRGDFVQPAGAVAAKPLLAVARTDIVRIFVDVPEMESPSVEAGRGGYVNVQALPDRIVEGKVARTSWVLGAKSDLADRAGPSQSQRPAAAGNVRYRAHPSPRASRCLRSPPLGNCSRGQASVLLDREGSSRSANSTYSRAPGRQRRGGSLRSERRRVGRAIPGHFAPGRPTRPGRAAGGAMARIIHGPIPTRSASEGSVGGCEPRRGVSSPSEGRSPGRAAAPRSRFVRRNVRPNGPRVHLQSHAYRSSSRRTLGPLGRTPQDTGEYNTRCDRYTRASPFAG